MALSDRYLTMPLDLSLSDLYYRFLYSPLWLAGSITRTPFALHLTVKTFYSYIQIIALMKLLDLLFK